MFVKKRTCASMHVDFSVHVIKGDLCAVSVYFVLVCICILIKNKCVCVLLQLSKVECGFLALYPTRWKQAFTVSVQITIWKKKKKNPLYAFMEEHLRSE